MAAQKFEPLIHHFIAINNEHPISVIVAICFLNQIKKFSSYKFILIRLNRLL